jgi:hypothetical protein
MMRKWSFKRFLLKDENKDQQGKGSDNSTSSWHTQATTAGHQEGTKPEVDIRAAKRGERQVMCALIMKKLQKTETGPYGNQMDKGYEGERGVFEHVWR